MKIEVTQEDIDHATRSSVNCPIARAMKRKFPENVICVLGGYISLGRREFDAQVQIIEWERHLRLPKVAYDFIERFDYHLPAMPFEFEILEGYDARKNY